jgi:hypothetical protein
VGLSLRELLVLGVALCGCVASCCWCLLFGFRPVSSINKPGTSFLINGWGKTFAPQFKKNKDNWGYITILVQKGYSN